MRALLEVSHLARCLLVKAVLSMLWHGHKAENKFHTGDDVAL